MEDQAKYNRVTNVIKQGKEADLKLSAQTNKLLQPVNDQFTTVLTTAKKFIADRNNFYVDRVVMLLLMAYGLRIGEVLGIRLQDIRPTGTILIKASKGSDDRLISGLQFSEYIYKNRLSFTTHLRQRNRWYYYRLFKRLGIYRQMTGNENTSVTHVFRYQFVAEVKELTGSTETTQNIIGHKSLKNTKRYENKS